MSVKMIATLQYDNVMMDNDITIAKGMSLVGRLASSPRIIPKKQNCISSLKNTRKMYKSSLNAGT